MLASALKAVPHPGTSYRTFQLIVRRTCSILAINDETNRVDSLHLGDSGYIVLRKVAGKWECIFRSEDLVHAFNCPHQIGTMGDDPTKAHCESHALLPDDVVVLATDGLWDNVWEKDIIQAVDTSIQSRSANLDAIAQELVELAHHNSVDK
jgi:protein phosphatase PTC7